jgi:predicted nuclease with RNAse H fold
LITLGLDLASQPERTAACFVAWENGRARAFEPHLRLDDAELLELTGRAEKIGLDVPLGWPDAFVQAVNAHHGGDVWPGVELSDLRFRATDRFVRESTGRWPLSPSTGWLVFLLLRVSKLLSGLDVDRSGGGTFVEVYPAAALARWSLTRAAVVELPWLQLEPEVRAEAARSNDVVDALVAALVARAAARGLCEPIPAELRERAAREGWIALPLEGSLERLA